MEEFLQILEEYIVTLLKGEENVKVVDEGCAFQ